MKMKRLLALALAGVMTFSMAACGGGSEDKKAEGEQKTVNGDVLDAEQHFNTYLFSEPSTLDSVKGNDNYGNGILLNIMEPLTRMDEEDGKMSELEQEQNPGSLMKMEVFGHSSCVRISGQMGNR